jgi:AraC-like DNA-binding protein
MRFLGGRRSVFFTWLLSYSAILVMVLGASLLMHLQARRVLIGQIDTARTATLRQAANAIGSRLQDLERLDLHISWNPRLSSFTYLQGPLLPADHYALTLLFRDFLIYRAAYPFVRNFFVYFHNSDIVLSAETVCTSSLFHELYMKQAIESYRDFLSLMRSTSDRRYQVLGDAVAYVKPLPADRFLPVNATLVILVDRAWFTDTLDALAWNEQESIAILDREDRILAQVGRGAIPAGLRYDEMDDLKTLRMRYGKGLLLTAVTAPVSGWKVVSVLPEEALMRPVTSLQTVTILGLAVCLAAGGLMAFSFAKRNYSRISEVTRDMASLAGIRVDSGNEYAILREAVSATLSWKEKLDSDLKQNNAAMRQNFLRRLVRGRFANVAELEQSFADFGIVPFSPYHVVFIVHPEGLPDPSADPHEAGRRIASLIIASTVEAIIDKAHRGFVAEYDDMLVCIVSLRLLSALEWNNDLDTTIDATRKYLQATFGLRTTVGMSTLVNGIESIPQAFQEALDALEYKLVVGAGTVIRYGDVRNRHSVYRCSLETEQQLHNAIRVGDEEKAREILGLVIDRNLRSGEVSVQGLKCFIFDMYNILSQAVASLDEGRQRELAETIQPLMQALAANSSLASVEDEVLRVALEVCRSMRSFRKDTRIALEVKEYVRAGHADLNLSIGMIADRFGMSQGYLSRLFRESAGQGLLDFIAEVRIAHAKDLMATGRASLEQVAGSVGYTSANALIRAFKKHEGVTPGQYRNVGAPAAGSRPIPRSPGSSPR